MRDFDNITKTFRVFTLDNNTYTAKLYRYKPSLINNACLMGQGGHKDRGVPTFIDNLMIIK